MNGNGPSDNGSQGNGGRTSLLHGGLHPAWADLITYCEELGFGELEKLKIQNGIPMMAELTVKKVKFGTTM